MTQLLLRLFVKDYYKTEDPAVRSAIGKLSGIIGILCNTLLTVTKLMVGIFSGSVSIIADGLNNLSDAAASLVTLVGFRLAQRPADKNHPYGHARYEYLSGFLVAVLILRIGAELIKNAIKKIIAPGDIFTSGAILTVLLLSVLLKLWLYIFYRKLGQHIHSTTLFATATDSRNDVLTTGAVLIGCLINFLFRINIDGWIGLGVSIFIIVSGIRLIKDTISPLLGEKADDAMSAKIRQGILSHPEVLGIHDLLVHDYGPGKCYASVHAELAADQDSILCHNIIDNIERDIWRELQVHLVIHYDPVIKDDAEQNAIRCAVENGLEELHFPYSIHDFRLVRNDTGAKISFDLSIPYKNAPPQEKIQKVIDDILRQRNIPYPAEIRFDKEL